MSSNREFVLHCQVRYEANSIDPKSRFKLRSAKIAPILGYIARRPAFRENRGLACAQVSSLSRAFAALHDENWCSPSDALLAKIPTVVIDRIHIEQLEVHGRVGVPDSERAQPQRLTLNLTLWPKIAELQDNLANTVNYSAVAECVKEFVSQHDYKLIETLGEQIAAHLLAQFNLRKVEVEVRKFVLPDANYVSVTAVREDEAT